MPDASARVHQWRGAAAVTLSSRELEATFLPELNMLGVSLRLGGEEFLALPGGVAAYRGQHTTGLPFLAPWANRLSMREYRSRRTRVDLRGLDLHVDGSGLPIHGTMSARDAWDVVELSARGSRAKLRGAYEYRSDAQLAGFPFPHRLETRVEVDGRSLAITTRLTPASRRAVPVSFGFHPYFRLPRGRRAHWQLRLPGRVHLELDERGIPTGSRRRAPAERRPIGARTFDDLFELERGRTLSLEGAGRRLGVHFGAGYTHTQVYAPPGTAYVCLEPMTAPTNALVSGSCPVVAPGETFVAHFLVVPEMLSG